MRSNRELRNLMGPAEVLCGGLEVYTGKGGPRALKFGCLGASGGYETRCNGDLCRLLFVGPFFSLLYTVGK